MPEGDQEQQKKTFEPGKGAGEPSKEPSLRERISKFSFLRLQELIEDKKEQARRRREEYREEGAGDPLIQRRAKLIEEWTAQKKSEFEDIKTKAADLEKLRADGKFKNEEFARKIFEGSDKVASKLTEEDLNKDPNSPYAGIREYMFRAYLKGVKEATGEEKAKTEGEKEPKEIKPQERSENPYLDRIASRLDSMGSQALERVEGEILTKIASGELPEGPADSLLLRIRAALSGGKTEGKAMPERDTMAAALKDLSIQIGGLKRLLEQSGQVHPSLTPEQIAQMTRDQVIAYSERQTDQMRSIFGRLPPEDEKRRWVDAELENLFYARFQPNSEPYFYQRLTQEGKEQEAKEWEARWTLARAAFYKDNYGAFPDKLAENQDLISLTKEQMERLYNITGVKEAMEWYVSAVIRGDKGIRIIREGKEKDITFLECEDGKEFNFFREKLRNYLRTTVFRNDPHGNEEEVKALETKIRSADAIAWNFIYVGNLAESVDSRYSIIRVNGVRYQGRRHDFLAPKISSDDLRAVFHPQEKAENKFDHHQAWGNFGKWGITQMDGIKKEVEEGIEKKYKKVKRGNRPQFEYKYVFVGADRKTDYWGYEIINNTSRVTGRNKDGTDRVEIETIVQVRAPECYPVFSMKSFFETYKDGEENGRTLLERLLKGEDINWRDLQADPWKTNYLTIRLRKAVGMFDYFTKEAKEGWARALLDIYTRLGSEGILYDYYYKTLLPDLPDLFGLPDGPERDRLEEENEKIKDKTREMAEKQAKTHFHNLKVWAVYAVQGGVGRPQDRNVTDPYSESALEVMHRTVRRDHEALLRKPQLGYLNRGLFGLFNNEDLIIKSIE